MAKDPAFLFYYQDFLVGTSFMTLEETGAYIKLLCFQAAKGPLKEEAILKKIPLAIWQSICCNFKNGADGFYNERLEVEIQKRRLFTQSRRNNLHMDKHMDKHMRSVLTPHMENENDNTNVIKDIIEDLNIILKASYKPSSSKNKELIQARLNEGHTLVDFKIVHRKMARAWGLDNKMRQYLRPLTLYSNKFESYLNRPEDIKQLTIQQQNNLKGLEELNKEIKNDKSIV